MNDEITRREEQVLLAINELQEDAYLVSIMKHLTDLLDKSWTVGAVHKPLMRLENMGFIDSFTGEATAVRGGRGKKIYKITERGLEVLRSAKKTNDLLWANFSG
ncbi:MAG: PadR family transcriptional regulator [Bacteroidetes bacterium]|nr:PadR family transcriptional regulator [Bacteroidota bacterium]